MSRKWKYSTSGIPDRDFIRGKVPMTKSEVRSVSLSKLRLVGGMNVLDIGAGTGSVSIECAVLGCSVTAIERNSEGIELITQNASKFFLDSITIIEGRAPENLPGDSKFQRVFIGGSGGELEGIFLYLETHLEPSGILVANTITIENTGKIMELLDKHGYKDIEAVSLNLSRSRKVGSVHMMMAENPVTIISGKKGD